MDPAVVAAWAAVAAAIFGPIIGVFMAHSFARYEATRNEATSLFRTILENCQSYRIAFDDAYAYCHQWKADVKQAHQVIEEFKTKYAHSAHPVTLDLSNQINTSETRWLNAFRDLRNQLALINADLLSLRLLFDKKAQKCEQALEELGRTYYLFHSEQMPSHDECEKQLSRLIDTVINEMKPLHDALVRRDPLGESN